MATTDSAGKRVLKSYSTITMETTPKIAEKIAVAQTIGQLSLALRSIADTTVELERAIAAGEVEVPETDDPKAERRMLLAIAAKPVDSGTTYTIGADVSRFQRATVPGRPPAVDGSGQPVPSSVLVGPRVRVARGNSVTVVPVGAK
jgi:pilus assembly protein CpaB